MESINRLLEAAKLPVVLIVGLHLVSKVISFLALIAGAAVQDTVINIAILVLSFITYGFILVNLAVFVWTGYRAATTYQSQLIECGIAGALTALVAGVVSVVVNIIFSVISVLALGYVEPATIPANTVFAGFGVFTDLVCGAATIFISIMINFVVSLIGGLIGGAKN